MLFSWFTLPSINTHLLSRLGVQFDSCCLLPKYKSHYCSLGGMLPCWSLLWFIGIISKGQLTIFFSLAPWIAPSDTVRASPHGGSLRMCFSFILLSPVAKVFHSSLHFNAVSIPQIITIRLELLVDYIWAVCQFMGLCRCSMHDSSLFISFLSLSCSFAFLFSENMY